MCSTLCKSTQVFALKLMVCARTRHGTESVRGARRQPDDLIGHVEERRNFVAGEHNRSPSLLETAQPVRNAFGIERSNALEWLIGEQTVGRPQNGQCRVRTSAFARCKLTSVMTEQRR